VSTTVLMELVQSEILPDSMLTHPRAPSRPDGTAALRQSSRPGVPDAADLHIAHCASVNRRLMPTLVLALGKEVEITGVFTTRS